MRKSAISIGVAAALLLAGTGMAASRWVITSVHQIKPHVLRELRGKRGPRGATGATGAQGPMGPQGPAGPAGSPLSVAIDNVDSSTVTLGPDESTDTALGGTSWEASCPTGDMVYGTGFNAAGVGQAELVEAYGYFVGGFIYNPTNLTIQVTIEAVCGPAATTTGPNALVRRSDTEQEAYRADLRRAVASLSG